MAPMRSAAVLAVLSCVGSATGTGMKMTSNPVRRVVAMLQDMQHKITEEGKKDKALYDKFMCQCDTGKATLKASVADATTKIPRLESDIEKGSAEKTQLAQDIAQAKIDRVSAEAAVAEALALRTKEASAFEKSSAESSTNIASLGKAVAALSKGLEGSFLQTPVASALRKMLPDADLSDADRDSLSVFLQGQQGDEEEVPSSTMEILGIIKTMKEDMEKDLQEATTAENESKKQYEALMDAKNKEIAALKSAVETKTARLGDAGIELVDAADDLEDSRNILKEDSAFLQTLESDCGTRGGEWDKIVKTRGDELIALADTIKVLNDDDALDLFKKAIPASSFIQVQYSSKDVLDQARRALEGGKGHDFRLDLISLAMRGKKVNFDKVVGMLDQMVTLLKEEQTDDDSKKAYCTKELDAADDLKKNLERTESQITTAIAEGKEVMKALFVDIESLTAGIKDLDHKVVEATQLRKEENANYKQDLAANTAAQELLNIAKNRLMKFYNPAGYKPAPKVELAAADRIVVNLGGDAPATPAPGGIAGTGVRASFVQVKRETKQEYSPKTKESGGVIAMIDLLIQDLAKEMTEMKTGEKDAQGDYEHFMSDSANKRETDSKSLSTKEATKAGAEESLLKNEADHKANAKELKGNMEIIMGLHQECDWLLANFDVRVKARSDEVESLNRAKAVLSGADFSFLQTVAMTRHLRRVSRH